MAYRKARVYIASKLQHAEKWQELFGTKEVELSSSWVNSQCDDANPQKCIDGWAQKRIDVLGSDAVIVYSEPGEILRGALVEVGIAISVGIPVFAVGPLDGTWHYSPLVWSGWKSVEQVLRHIVSTTYLRETQRPDFVEPTTEVENLLKEAVQGDFGELNKDYKVSPLPFSEKLWQRDYGEESTKQSLSMS